MELVEQVVQNVFLDYLAPNIRIEQMQNSPAY